MRSFRLLLPFAFLPLALFGQKIDIKPLKDLSIRNIGPAGMSGRVTAIDVDLSDPDIIYIGGASGGVWKSTNGGISWNPVFDEQPLQSIGSIAVCQRNPSIVWVGTGEGNPRNSLNTGAGIYKSLDGGKTWKCMGLEKTKTLHRIIINKDNPDIVFAAALGSPWGPNEERGVFRTKDGGKTWEKVLYVNNETGCADLVVDPTNPDKLIAAMWEHGRKPWTFNSGGPGSGLYVTLDGGTTWEKQTDKNGLPKGELGRIGLAIAQNKPNIVYALVEAKDNALFKSTDGGANWSKINDRDIGNRPFYYADIFVDPLNENRLFNLYSSVTRSEDGGRSFDNISNAIHPDHHAFWVHPQDPNYMLEGNDGGLNISRDGGNTWRFVANLPLAQFYHISYDMDIPYNVAGGLQDNGSWVGPSSIWRSGGILNQDWQEVFFGDGFDVVFKPDNNRYVYAMSQQGNVGLVDRTTGQTKFVKPVHPEGIPLRFNWNAAISLDPFEPCGVYFGSQFLHYSNDCGQHWTILSPDLTTNDPEKQKQDKSGGLTIDATGAENHTTILAIAPSPADKKVIWVGTDDGNLQLTRDGGTTWTNLASRLPGVKAGSWIPYIEVSAKNPGEAFVIVNDYRRNDYRPMAFQTTDYGQSWKQIADEKKVEGFTLSIVQDPVEPKLLWLGTDQGLYFSIDGGDSWNKWTNGYPSVQTADLKIHPREADLIIGTFGRAVWILDDTRPFRAMAATRGDVLKKDFKVFEAPDAYLAETRSYNGLHFPGDAEYGGANRSTNAMITVWVKPEEKGKPDNAEQAPADKKGKKADTEAKGKEKKPAKRPERVKIAVFNTAGDTIRNFSARLEDGMNRIYWNMRRNGVRFPGRQGGFGGGGGGRGGRGGGNDDPPAGPTVLPGVYKLVFVYGDQKDSTLLTVHDDPRLHRTIGDYQQREAVYKDYAAVIEAAAKGYDRLQEAGKTVDRVNAALVNLPDSTRKMITDLGKAVKDTLASLEKLYTQPDGMKGIQRSADNLQAVLGGANRYVNDIEGQPSQMALLTVAQAKSETRKVLDKVNAFLNGDFVAYQRKVEAVQYSLFKPLEPVRME
ncbi:MAG: hypothetical protein H6562_09110 [Lewinellaceae bacterium]|nr:hypothetical protein [Lewinellaceae bacterium]